MGKQRLRNWILSNEFFQKNGGFSKSAFIMMNTWILVILKYLTSGLSFTYAKGATVINNVVIPASQITYSSRFESGEAVALLTLVFGLYFGNKFAPPPGTPPLLGDAAQERRDITADANQARKDITADAAQDRKNIVEDK
jgi:hypothetical protein